MVKIYVRKIRAGEMTLDDVPARWHDSVAAALEALTTRNFSGSVV